MLQFGWLNEKEKPETRYESWSNPVTDSELSLSLERVTFFADPDQLTWLEKIYLVVCSSFISSWGACEEWLLKLSKHWASTVKILHTERVSNYNFRFVLSMNKLLRNWCVLYLKWKDVNHLMRCTKNLYCMHCNEFSNWTHLFLLTERDHTKSRYIPTIVLSAV